MPSQAAAVEQYLAELPADRRRTIAAVRAVILKNLPQSLEEGMQYGMIGYYVPHSVYPAGYHCDPRQPLPFAGLASQKNHMSLYLMCLYGGGEHLAWFQEAWRGAGKKLDMGKACIRFKQLDDVPLEVIGQLLKRISIEKYIERCAPAAPAAAKPRTPKAPVKRMPAKKSPAAPPVRRAKKKRSG